MPRLSDSLHATRARVVHPHAWIWEPLEADPRFLLRAMFGCKAAYLDGKMMLCFAAKDEPWRGVLVCTAREQHASLMQTLPALTPHPVLSKWLYLPEARGDFETVAARIVELVRRRDPRIGVLPSPHRSRKTRSNRVR
ncbi:MAG TPA: hypothetical protein PLV33_04945 [Opitutaceae bacterium]|nr:hypothetical protein [Opitutaceae bacterium]HPK49310.1 hypothetical protein [Opitutaceae bacterium]